jgi:hypothetical protein
VDAAELLLAKLHEDELLAVSLADAASLSKYRAAGTAAG